VGGLRPFGPVDFGDLSFFAPNFGKRRDLVQSGAQTLIFPPNFPDAWRGGSGAAAAALKASGMCGTSRPRTNHPLPSMTAIH
jgi:hypothetical protein